MPLDSVGQAFFTRWICSNKSDTCETFWPANWLWYDKKKLAEIDHSYQRGLGVDLVIDDGSAAVLEDLEEPINQNNSELTPGERVELSIIRDREIAAYEHEQRLQYVRQFLQNARSKGYDIILNDKLEVVQINRVQDEKPYRGDESIRELFD